MILRWGLDWHGLEGEIREGGRLGEEADGNVRTYRIVLYYCVVFLDRWVLPVSFFFLFRGFVQVRVCGEGELWKRKSLCHGMERNVRKSEGGMFADVDQV